MMKKRVLMPLLVASMLMGFAVIHSCTKNQDKNLKNISFKALYESLDEDCPYMRNEMSGDRDASIPCPYCSVLIHSGDSHWHYFGEPASMKPPYGDDEEKGFDPSEMMPVDLPIGEDGQPHPHFYAVDACLDGLFNGSACPYSGVLKDDPETIQSIIDDPDIPINDPLKASWMLLPRFHAHKIKYRAVVNGGMNNTWHTGGGVPGWPSPEIEQPN